MIHFNRKVTHGYARRHYTMIEVIIVILFTFPADFLTPQMALLSNFDPCPSVKMLNQPTDCSVWTP